MRQEIDNIIIGLGILAIVAGIGVAVVTPMVLLTAGVTLWITIPSAIPLLILAAWAIGSSA